MAVVKISDVIEPKTFTSYTVNRTMELSALVQSGIVQHDNEFDTLASSPGRTVNMPYWNDLTGDDEVLDDSNPLTPDKIGSGQDIAVILRRGRAWGTNDLAGALAGSDPAKAIGDLVAAYWARMMQKALLSTLGGVFSSTSMASNVLDISAGTGGAEKIGASSFVDATQKLGDAKEQLTGVMMHSATEAALAKLNLIQTIKPGDGSTEVKVYMGKRVIVDDGCPVNAGVYSTFLFGPGAIALGNGNPVRFTPTETARDALAGNDFLVNRKTFILHPRGVAFQSAAVAKSSPTNTELGTATNWTRVFDSKKIRIVQFKHKI